MTSILRRSSLVVFAITAQIGVTGCSVQVDKDAEHHQANVDIRALGGGVSVKGGIDSPDTGLTPYPGATPMRSDDGDAKEAADVNVSAPFVKVHVVAAKYESADAPDKVLEFYRSDMKKFGEVMECTGDIDFKNGRMVCRHRLGRSETTLGAGTEHHRHVVAVKARGNGTELSLVSVETSDKS